MIEKSSTKTRHVCHLVVVSTILPSSSYCCCLLLSFNPTRRLRSLFCVRACAGEHRPAQRTQAQPLHAEFLLQELYSLQSLLLSFGILRYPQQHVFPSLPRLSFPYSPFFTLPYPVFLFSLPLLLLYYPLISIIEQRGTSVIVLRSNILNWYLLVIVQVS